jgi:predicted  nucleic acid-binding Zn-ribbon protein
MTLVSEVKKIGQNSLILTSKILAFLTISYLNFSKLQILKRFRSTYAPPPLTPVLSTMKKALLACSALLLTLLWLNAEPVNDYMKARLLIQQGDAAEKSGATDKAVEKYSAALEKLTAIQKTSPEWEPDSISSKIKYCNAYIEKHSKASPSIETAAETPAPVEKKPAPAPAKTATIAKPKATTTAKTTAKPSSSVEKTETTKIPASTSTAKASTTAKPKPAATASTSKPKTSTTTTAKAAPKATPPPARYVEEENSVWEEAGADTGGKWDETSSKGANLATTQQAPKYQYTPRPRPTYAERATVAKSTAERPAPAPRERTTDKQETVTLLKENQQLRDRLQQVRSENLDAIQDLNQQVASLRSSLSKTQKRVDTIQKTQSEGGSRATEQLAQDLRSTATELRAAHQVLDKKVQNVSVENSTLKKEVRAAQDELRGLLDSSRGEIVALRGELQQAKSQLKNLHDDNAMLWASGSGAKPAEKSVEIENLTAEQQSIREKLASLENSVKEGSGVAKTDKNVEVQLENLATEQQSIRDKLASVEAGLKDITAGFDEVRGLRADLAKTNTQLENMHKGKTPETPVAAAPVIEEKPQEVAKAEPKAEQTEVSAVPNEKLQGLVDENQALKDKLAKLETGIKSVQSNLDDARELKTQLEKAQGQIESLQKENETIKTGSASAEPRPERDESVKGLTKENEELKDKLAKLESGMQGINANIEEIQKLKEKLDKSQNQLQDMQKENENLRSRGDSQGKISEDEFKKLADEKSDLKKKLDEMEASLKTVDRAEVQNMKSDLSRAQARLEDLQRENENLKKETERVKVPATVAAQPAVIPEPVVEAPKPAPAPVVEVARQEPVVQPAPVVISEPVKSEPAPAASGISAAAVSGWQTEEKPVEPKVEAAPAPSAATVSVETPAPVATVAKAEPAPAPKVETPVSAPAPAPAATVQPVSNPVASIIPAGANFSGEVVILNMKEKFVVVNFKNSGSLPPENAQFSVFRNGVPIGSVRITGPVKPPFVPADIIQGEIQKGDMVKN